MSIKINNASLMLIKTEAIPSLNITANITPEVLIDIFRYFESREIYLSQNITDGIEVDRQYLKDVCSTVNELLDSDNVDIEDLNKRLFS